LFPALDGSTVRHVPAALNLYRDAIRRDREGRVDQGPTGKLAAPKHAGIAVRKDYPRHVALKRTLDRYERDAYESPSAKRYTGERRKEYAAAVAWTRLKKSGQFADYFGKKGHHAMKPRHYKSGPKKGQFMPRSHHPAKAKKRSSGRRKAVAKGPARRRAFPASPKPRHRTQHAKRSHHKMSAYAPRTHHRRRSSGRKNVYIMAAPKHHRSGHRRHFRMRAPIILSGPHTASLAIGLLSGFAFADLFDRWYVGINPTPAAGSQAPQLPAGVPDVATYNDLVYASRPGGSRGWASPLIQVGVAVGMGVLAFWTRRYQALSAFLVGQAFGWGLHPAWQLVNGYVFEPIFAGSNAGKYMFAHEFKAANALDASGTPPVQPFAGALGQPSRSAADGLGAPPQQQRTKVETHRPLPVAPPAKMPPVLALGAAPAPIRAVGSQLTPTPAIPANAAGTTPTAQSPQSAGPAPSQVVQRGSSPAVQPTGGPKPASTGVINGTTPGVSMQQPAHPQTAPMDCPPDPSCAPATKCANGPSCPCKGSGVGCPPSNLGAPPPDEAKQGPRHPFFKPNFPKRRESFSRRVA
jgi:hypothetical protein